jgi:pyruvate dehydrogenase E2 component (dihydrolipoamide acetyltransferase)
LATTVHLPKVGMTMEEGDLVRWLVADGAAVTRGQPIFAMETEKVNLDVEADGDGVLRQLVAAGARLKPGAVVGCLLAAGETEVPSAIRDQVGTAPDAPAAAAAQPTATATAPEPAPAERVAATPVARRLAAEHGIDLATVTGSGPGGRIVEADVLGRIAHPAEIAGGGTPPPASQPASGVEERSPYVGRRRTIGERMHQSLQGSAQLTLSVEARVDTATQMLHGVNREWRSERVVVTLTALAMRACALALREHPALNARLDGDTIVRLPAAHIGFAVHSDGGLVVPVVHNVDSASLQDVCRAVATLSDRAQSNTLALADISGATFTVSSLESFEVDAFTPIVNPPQAAILGIGRVREVPTFEGSQVVRAQVTTLSLTFDHRLLDGAPAARFLGRVVELLGRPYMLM